jgi:hypothetical protein
VSEDKQKKLDPHLIKMTLVGYEPGSKGYRLWNSTTQVIVLSHGMTFDEHSYPARVSSEPSASPVPLALDGPVTITYPATEQQILETLEHLRTPENPPVPSRETTVFHTPSCPPLQMPPPCVCLVYVQRDPGT